MRVALLQDAVHLPSLGGGNKANRLLMERLAAAGFDCHMVTRVPSAAQRLDGGFGLATLAARGIAVTGDEQRHHYRHEGVQVAAFDFDAPDIAAALSAHLAALRADWLLVSDDGRGLFLETALALAPNRVVVLVHTHFHLPFGPESRTPDPARHALMARAAGIVVVSRYSQDYLARHGGLAARILHFPVFGTGPFNGPAPAGCVAMINPCPAKGLSIFLDLADQFRQVPFAAVPTWGADADVMAQLHARPNIRILPAGDDIGAVLAPVRVLLAPSLLAETFGYVAIDAMLRGIPALMGNLGGQPEAALGVATVLPVHAADPAGPPPVAAWRAALLNLLTDPVAYRQASHAARTAAQAFLPQTDIRHFIAPGAPAPSMTLPEAT